MDYIRTGADGQLIFTQSTDFLKIPVTFHTHANNEVK